MNKRTFVTKKDLVSALPVLAVVRFPWKRDCAFLPWHSLCQCRATRRRFSAAVEAIIEDV